jgi:sec-independent protein translocase protein TatA
MFGSVGIQELLVILIIALLLFGAKRLPEIGRTLGKGISEFRKAQKGITDAIGQEIEGSDKEGKGLAKDKTTSQKPTVVEKPKQDTEQATGKTLENRANGRKRMTI